MMRRLLRTVLAASLWMGAAFAVVAAPVAVPERKDQTWKLLNLADAAGLSRANLFNIAFETGGEVPRRGTAWIATSDGLREFDGYTWRRHGRAEGLPSDFVRAVMVTRGGDLWVGTDRGAGIYDGRTFRTMGTETHLAGPNVRRIVEDPTGAIWFCCDSWPHAGADGGLTRFQGGQWRTYRMSDGLPSTYVVNFLRDSKGGEYAATLGALPEGTATVGSRSSSHRGTIRPPSARAASPRRPTRESCSPPDAASTSGGTPDGGRRRSA